MTKKRVGVRMPRVMSERRIDESLASNEIKSEFKRRQRIRRMYR